MATRRSTTGCAACKRKRRKCDEGKPRCQRCVSSGEPCNYEYVEPPNAKPHLVRRTRPAPRTTTELWATAVRDAPTTSEFVDIPSLRAPGFGGSATSSDFTSTATQGNNVGSNSNLATTSDHAVHASDVFATSLTSDRLLGQINPARIVPSPTQMVIGAPHRTATMSSDPGARPSGLAWLYEEYEVAEDCDPEGIQALLLVTPTIDRNVKENALPFVLQCYSQWAVVAVFEPLKIAPALKNQVIELFGSEETRKRTILVANVMDMFAKSLSVNNIGKSIVTYLASKVQGDVRDFMATSPSPVPEIDRQHAMRTLDSTLEIMTLQVDTQPLGSCIQWVEDAAPVFRRACPEPLGQPLDLANILLEPDVNLRHFVSCDIISSLTTGRPTHFKYEVAFSAELCEQMFQLEENCGLQCLHGLPDQFIMIFAWINSLCEIPGAAADANLINWIETKILQVKLVLDQSADPALRLGRMAVMCRADANDARIVRVLKNFMRLVRGIKPERNSDTYLVAPMTIAGVAASKEQDRITIHRRIRNVPECSTPGTVGYDMTLELEDIWTRAKSEGRAAVWADLRIACLRVTGK